MSNIVVQTLAGRPDPASLPRGSRVYVNATGDEYRVRNGAYVQDPPIADLGLKLAVVPPDDLLAAVPTSDGFDVTYSLLPYATQMKLQVREAAAADWSAATETTANSDDDAAEVSTATFTGLDQSDVADTHFLVSGASGRFYVWFNVNELGTDPEVANATGVEVALGASADDAAIATAVAAALDALDDFGATALAAAVTITDAAVGFRTAIDAGDSGATVAVTTRGIPVGTVREAVTGLTAETAYEMRVRAEHDLYDTAWSDVVTITTLAA